MLNNDKISKSALGAIKKLNSAGFQAYLVGGAVRDILLDLKPKDYDISTDATPEQLKRLFGRRAKVIGRRFRLVHIHTYSGILEVSTFRRMPTLEERQGRKTDSGLIVWRDNCYGTLKEDSTRRDFTINAIYYNPYCKKQQIIDYAGGLSDLRNGVIRSLGSPKVRIAEDPVRMLRACKLMGQYGFQLERGLKKEVSRNAATIRLSSRTRLLEELFKILKKPYTYPTFQACYDTGLLHYILPTLAKEWTSEKGALCQTLLMVRDDKLVLGEIFPSRISGLALITLPFLRFRGTEDYSQGFLPGDFQRNDSFRPWLKEFLSPYRVPNYLISKVFNVLKMQSTLNTSKNIGRIQLHPDYFRARDTLVVYAKAMIN